MSKASLANHYFHLNVEVITGGFILSFPKQLNNEHDPLGYTQVREIFTSQQKLSKKIKEVLDELTKDADEAPE